MRLAHQIRPLLVGLPIVVSQALLAVLPAAGWDLNSLRGTENSQAPGQASGGKVRVVNGGAIAPTTPRWTDGQAVQQAYAEDVPSTGAVQQTAHSGPSRNGTLIGGANAAPFNSAKARVQANGKKPPMWRGYSLRMPTKLFTRGATSAPPAMPNPVATNHPGDAAARARQGTSGPGVGGYPPPTGHPIQNPRVAAQSRLTKPTQQAPTQQVPSQQRSTQHATTSASFSGPTLAAPSQSAPTEAAPATLEPKTPADRLIVHAHELAAHAQSEEDFSQIIETCRRARASQASAPLGDYANQLSAWAFNRRGQLKAEAGRTQEALLDFDDAIRANPQLWRALHNRGVLRAQTGQFEPAFDDFNFTIEFNPEFAKAYSNRAALFVVAGDLPAALEDYGHAIELDPNLAVAHRGRGRVCHLLGRLDESLDHYDAAVQLAPKDAYAIASRADLLTDLGRYVDAAEGYNRAIGLDPNSANAYRGSAWLLATCPDSSVRDARLAVERAELAIQLEGKDDAVSFDTLAAAQASAGDFSAAMQTLRQAIEIAPDNERDAYQDRLMLYQRAKPYRIAPVRNVAQVSYESN